MSRAPRLLLLLVTASLGAGCARVADGMTVVEANRLHARGDYQGAIAGYLRARRASYPATIDYNLANSYARLGEFDAASELYSAAILEGDRGIAAAAHFNEGIALYERGLYERSWRAFRASLSVGSARGPGMDTGSAFAREARRNLELAWRAWKRSLLARSRSLAPSGRVDAAGDETQLKLLERLETGRWSPGSAEPSTPSYKDY